MLNRLPALVGASALALLLTGTAAGADPARRFKGHDGVVRAVAFSPDGKTLATAGQDHSVRLWDVATGKQLRTCAGHTNWALSAEFSPDGKALATAGSDETVRLWDVATGKEVRRLTGHNALAHCATFSPDGKVLASGGYDQRVRLWDVRTGRPLRNFRADTNHAVFGVAFSPDGRTLATAGNDTRVRVYDPATGGELRRCVGHTVMPVTVAFSPDGRTLASCAHDNTVRLWEVATGKQRLLLGGHTRWVRGVAFSSCGRVLASGGFGGEVRLWESATGKELARLEGHKGDVYWVAFAPGDRQLASCGDGGEVLLWDVSGVVRRAVPKPVGRSEKELRRLWADLAGEAEKAYRAVGGLASSPGAAVDWLKGRLRPVAPLDAAGKEQVARLIGELGDAEPATRRRATEELARLGEPAGPLLRKALGGRPDVDVRLRLHVLLAGLGDPAASAEGLRALRAVEVLERIGNKEAHGLLRALAAGAPEARLTREAQASLRRLERRAGARP